MSHTNSTTNYSLPQFISTDKPAWLTDINGAFADIDTNIKTVSDAANTADGKAVAAQSAATAVDTKVGQLGALTTEVKTSIVDAINSVHTDITYLDPNGKFKARKYGNVVMIKISGSVDVAANSWTTIGTLPEAYRPSELEVAVVIDNSMPSSNSDIFRMVQITAAGSIQIWSYGAYTGHIIVGTITYIE